MTSPGHGFTLLAPREDIETAHPESSPTTDGSWRKGGDPVLCLRNWFLFPRSTRGGGDGAHNLGRLSLETARDWG